MSEQIKDKNPWQIGQVEETIIEFDENGMLKMLEVDDEAEYPFKLSILMAEGNAVKELQIELIDELGKLHRVRMLALANSDLEATKTVNIIE